MKKGFIIIFVMLFNLSVLPAKEKGDEKERLTVPCEWCDKIGMRDVMIKMKTTTQLLTQSLLYGKWDEVNSLSVKLKAIYDGLDLKNTAIPEEYWEFNEDYLRYFNRFLKACEEKDEDQAGYQLKRVKTACHHCHIRFVRRKNPDEDVGLERLYKDQFREFGDEGSYTDSQEDH